MTTQALLRGYEIDLGAISGLPLRLALTGWVMSLALAYAIAGALALAGVVISALYTGSALTTSALVLVAYLGLDPARRLRGRHHQDGVVPPAVPRRARSTAAALVGGAVLSTLFFPVLGLRLRGDLQGETPMSDA